MALCAGTNVACVDCGMSDNIKRTQKGSKNPHRLERKLRDFINLTVLTNIGLYITLMLDLPHFPEMWLV